MIATELPSKLIDRVTDSISAYTSVQFYKLVKTDGTVITKYILGDNSYV